MADINEFIEKLGNDIGDTFGPRIQTELEKVGTQIADQATPRVRDLTDQLIKEIADQATPRIRSFTDQLIKEILARQSTPVRDFIIGLIKDLVGRYDPAIAGNLRTAIVEDAVEISSDDFSLEIRERATGNLITSLSLPVHFRIQVNEISVNLEQATIQLQDVQL